MVLLPQLGCPMSAILREIDFFRPDLIYCISFAIAINFSLSPHFLPYPFNW
jgi:hypothetical protein